MHFVIPDVTVIGGADGPTAIFVASSVNWVLVAAAAVVVIAAILLIIIKKRKK